MMRTTWLILAMFFATSSARAEDAETIFEVKVRPVLVETCLPCHGGKKVSNGLRVDSREALLKGGESGPALVPGEPDRSLLIQAIRHTHPDIKMPPDKKLPETVVADFAAWVKRGAIWPQARTLQTKKHWAFEPVKTVDPPADLSGWSEHPIDRFIHAKLEAADLRPVALADKRVLIRRTTFDLIGLPPTPDEVNAFLADSSPNAFAKVVDRLLASPHYGERWGRHWMDVARYADTAGDNADYPIPEVRLYRDYIIDSFNVDKPYDQFVREQLAGDILAKQGPRENYAERVVATGFLALSRRYATAPYELWHLTMEDAIETTGRAFMGLTLRCARCHDHKYDPVTKEDYYALYGIFASTQFPWAGGEELHSMKKPREHFVPLLPPAESAPRLASYARQIEQVEAEIRRQNKESPLGVYLAELDEQLAAKARSIQQLEARKQKVDVIAAERSELEQERRRVQTQLEAKLAELHAQLWELRRSSLPAGLAGAYAVQDGKPTDVYVHVRGDIEQHGPTVKRNAPRFLVGDRPMSIPADASGRLQLAEWLTRPDHPLAARVMVNRIWQHHFAKGIVGTPSNFGRRGEEPTHPELLDYLARRFVESGWSIKGMHRLILSSKTYQLASAHEDANAAKDPTNRWYWRHDCCRLDAEAIRDALLAVSGNLNRSRPAAHSFPTIDKWTWTQHNPFKEVYPSKHRSVYLMTQRFQRHPYLALFDGPDPNTTTEQRASSTVPLQALFLLNNPFVTEQTEGFARRLFSASQDSGQRIDMAHQLAWCRPATAAERAGGQRYLQEYGQQLAGVGVAGQQLGLEALRSYLRVLLCANEFIYLD